MPTAANSRIVLVAKGTIVVMKGVVEPMYGWDLYNYLCDNGRTLYYRWFWILKSCRFHLAGEESGTMLAKGKAAVVKGMVEPICSSQPLQFSANGT